MFKVLKYNLQQAAQLIGQALVGGMLFNLPGLKSIRKAVYKMLFHPGKGCFFGEHVVLERQHRKLDGSISIGNKVKFSRNCRIDFTGHLIIKDKVIFSDGEVLTHYRDLDEYAKGNDVNIQVTTVIEEGAYIGSRALILPSCNYIGKHSRIGAGAVVTKDVPDYALVGGVPAKVLRYLPHDEE